MMVAVAPDWRPCQLVTLLEILEIEADAFCRLSGMMGQMLVVLARNELADEGLMGATFGELQREAERLKLRSVVQQLERMTAHFQSGRATAQTMHGIILELYNRMIDELSDKYFLMVRPERIEYYKNTALFGAEVQSKFPSLSFEIDEAGKSLALNRNTACVFHLMRLMELAIRAVARCLQIPDPIQPADRSWGAVLKTIRGAIENKWPTVATRTIGDGEIFDALYASLDAVKNPWRNGTMHPANKYTDDEAEHVFVAVRGFMKMLASRCDENGLPVA